MEPSIHHDLGRHDAQIEALQEQVRQLHKDMQAMNETLAAINQTLSEAKGGWRAMMLVGGIAATVGAMSAKILAWAGFIPK